MVGNRERSADNKILVLWDICGRLPQLGWVTWLTTSFDLNLSHHMEKNRGDHHQLGEDLEHTLVLLLKNKVWKSSSGNIHNAGLTAKKNIVEDCTAPIALYNDVLHIYIYRTFVALFSFVCLF